MKQLDNGTYTVNATVLTVTGMLIRNSNTTRGTPVCL